MLWLKFYDGDGKPVRMSAETASEDEAKKVLAIEIAALAKGEPVGLKPARVKVNDLLDDLVNDYTVNGRVLGAIAPGVARLRPAFGTPAGPRAHDGRPPRVHRPAPAIGGEPRGLEQRDAEPRPECATRARTRWPRKGPLRRSRASRSSRC